MVLSLRPPDGVELRPITRREYRQMGQAGLFQDERVELIDGAIVRMNAKGPTHESTVYRLQERLLIALDGRADVRAQSSFAASNVAEPEPDVAVVPVGGYDDDHPSEAFLLIEVADSSLKIDRGSKAKLYAEANVPEYWVVNLRDRLVEVHSDIVGGEYRRIVPYRPGDTIAPAAFPDVCIDLAQILR